MAAATLAGAQADARKAAASNSAGAMTGFMGMGFAQQAGGGINAQQLYAMGNQQPKREAPAAGGWKCSCGHVATGKFCPECGAKKPEEIPAGSWKCACGNVNKGKFCSECGSRKPAYRCDKCGWQPEDPMNPPKFCPECGDRFDEADLG